MRACPPAERSLTSQIFGKQMFFKNFPKVPSSATLGEGSITNVSGQHLKATEMSFFLNLVTPVTPQLNWVPTLLGQSEVALF